MITPVNHPSQLKKWYIVPTPEIGLVCGDLVLTVDMAIGAALRHGLVAAKYDPAIYSGVSFERYGACVLLCEMAGHPGRIRPRLSMNGAGLILQPNSSGSPDSTLCATYMTDHAQNAYGFDTDDAIIAYLHEHQDVWGEAELEGE
ncbi:hypothetical protein KS4_18240 [Poriferisphaera corsica]|uniref:Uncharacterized protein n=1 Tax=Poriferisphaera corsica TaxID=2528020 RepID=A0A517YU87_9BACT|nr:hypothetical protein [Poriferisphaera corsica]QDU33767.1 hypothetical protein KS4_18240 [Poriferisphaera corsica]